MGGKAESYFVDKQLVIQAAVLAAVVVVAAFLLGHAMFGLGAALGIAVSITNNRILEWSVRKISPDSPKKAKFFVFLSYYLRILIIFIILYLLFPLTGIKFAMGFLTGFVVLKLWVSIKQLSRLYQSFK